MAGTGPIGSASERGWFAIGRDVFEDLTFAKEPYTERLAWLWLISEAAWRDRVVDRKAGRGTPVQIPLKRGQLAHALSFLADHWMWTASKARRFLARLVKTRKIIITQCDTQNATHWRVITICDYDRFSRVEGSSDTLSETHSELPAEKQRHQPIESKKAAAAAVPARSNGQSQEGRALADDVKKILGVKPDAIGWKDAASFFAVGLTSGWTPEVVIAAAEKVADRRRRKGDGPPRNVEYLKGAIDDECQRSLTLLRSVNTDGAVPRGPMAQNVHRHIRPAGDERGFGGRRTRELINKRQSRLERGSHATR
jgi:hypothetical protein